MKKIIIFIPESKIGGPYNSQKRIMESDLKEKYQFYPLIIPRIRKFFNPFILKKMVLNIRKIKPDIIHLYGLQLDGFLMMLLAYISMKKIPRVLAIRGSVEEAIKCNFILRNIIKILEKWTLEKATVIYGVSNYVLSWKKVTKYSSKIVGRIFNFTIIHDNNTSKEDKNNLIKNINMKIGKETILIASSGRIVEEKGFKDLTDIIIYNNWPKKVYFLIMGEGNYLKTMKDRINNSKMKDRVYFTNQINNVKDYLSISDIFIMCTKHETLCNSIIEAGTYGIPVVASKVGGIPEIIKNEEDGFLFDVGNLEECKNSLLKLILDNDLRIKLGNNIKKNMLKKIEPKIICNQLDKIYKNL